MLRSGFLALRDIVAFYGLRIADDPAPNDPISVSRAEFEEVLDELARAGLPHHLRPGEGVARLRRLAGQLRRGPARTLRPRAGAARPLVVRPERTLPPPDPPQPPDLAHRPTRRAAVVVSHRRPGEDRAVVRLRSRA